MRHEEGYLVIKDIVNEWSSVYINQVFFDIEEEEVLK